jgi:release factor glutamine methyltransferase
VTVGEALRQATGSLAASGVPTPRVDAEILLGKVLGRSRSAVYGELGRPLAAGEAAALAALVARRARREPLAYVLGEWGFRRLTLRTDSRALVPRPETEILVERCLALISDIERPRVLDVGVGSGAIALSIALEHPGARVTGVDTSADALALARENAERTGVSVELQRAGFEAAEGRWDLVVSNPPYVAPADWETLEPEIRDWEPRVALVGDALHHDLARRVRHGALALEVGDGEARRVATTLGALGFRAVRVTRDLAERERVVEGRR